MDGSESVLSGRSERSERSHRSHGHRRHGRRSRSRDHDRDDRSVTIKSPAEENMGEDERIEVQILPQDDNWGAESAITGNTSVTDFTVNEDMSRFTKDMEDSMGFDCTRYVGSAVAIILAFLAFLSPIAMVVLPKVGLEGWVTEPCEASCEGLLISFAFKLLILLIGTWALFFRRLEATMPRVFIFRALILFLVFVLTFSFWLFYGVRIFDQRDPKYEKIVQFAVSLVDALLFIHYIAVILLEIRQLQSQFTIKIVRSPDGETRSFNMGTLSIQRAAVECLKHYYRDFSAYNPYLEHATNRRSAKANSFKVYDVDGVTTQTPHSRARGIFAAAARRRDSSHNDRFYEEQEYDRRIRKRRARLVAAAEEAFTHIKRLQDEQGPAIPMDPQEAAQAIFPSMARALQKYLRVTRQQPKYTMEMVLEHLAQCISHDMSPKAFLSRYLSQGTVIQVDKFYRNTQTWTLISDLLLSRAIEHGTVFQLKQGEVSILCEVKRIPHFNLTEEVIDPKRNKFVLRLNSETSV